MSAVNARAPIQDRSDAPTPNHQPPRPAPAMPTARPAAAARTASTAAPDSPASLLFLGPSRLLWRFRGHPGPQEQRNQRPLRVPRQPPPFGVCLDLVELLLKLLLLLHRIPPLCRRRN